jgi:malonate decarboxylase delta subunit
MEHLKFDYPSATRRVTNKAHVGVVGSGELEVLMQPDVTGTACSH